jgi:hypothetical protein
VGDEYKELRTGVGERNIGRLLNSNIVISTFKYIYIGNARA